MRSLVMLSLAAALVMFVGAGAALAQSGPATAPPAAADADAALAQLRESVIFARYDEALYAARRLLGPTRCSRAPARTASRGSSRWHMTWCSAVSSMA